jgi:thiol-disulfide isomerase/thioredoxin
MSPWTKPATILAALCLFPAALPAHAQQGDAPQQQQTGEEARPRPWEIMKAAHEAVSQIQTISFKASAHGVGHKATRTPTVEATVIAARATNDPFGWKFHTEGVARDAGKDPRRLLAAYDGTAIRSIREHEQKVIEAPVSNPDAVMTEGPGWVMAWLIRWPDMVHKCFGGEDPLVPSRYDGRMDVAGEPCHVVYVDYSELADPTLFDAWWYISERDSIPRRVEMHFIDGSDGFTVLTLTDLQPGAGVSGSTFSLAAPDGFEIVKPAEPERRVGARAVVRSGVPVGDTAPDWTLTDLDGKEHTLSRYRGKIVVMDFWATWCPPCRQAMPVLQRLHEKYKDQGVVIFGMNCWESGDPGAYMDENSLTYTTLLKADPVAQLYQVSGIPTFYIVGPDGKVVYSEVGFDPAFENKFADLVERLTAP